MQFLASGMLSCHLINQIGVEMITRGVCFAWHLDERRDERKMQAFRSILSGNRRVTIAFSLFPPLVGSSFLQLVLSRARGVRTTLAHNVFGVHLQSAHADPGPIAIINCSITDIVSHAMLK